MEQIHEITSIDPWFLKQLREMADLEARSSGQSLARAFARAAARSQTRRHLRRAPRTLVRHTDANAVRARRKELGVTAVFNRVDTCAAEFESFTPYLYSSYESENESDPSDRKKVMILGSGPNRIGQGIEFDYCCCHASFALAGVRSRIDHGQLQSGNRLHRLRHQRSPVLRAAHAGRSPEHLRRREAGWRDRPIRRADAAESGAAAQGRRRPDHRHRSRRHRSRRGSQIIRQAARRSGHSVARERHRHQRRRSLRGGSPSGLSGAGASQLRAGRTRHGDRLRRGDGPALHAGGRGLLARAAGADRPVPGRRHRSGRGRAGRSGRQRADRGHHGAHRGSGRAFGRQLLRSAAAGPFERRAQDHSGSTPSGWRARCT